MVKQNANITYALISYLKGRLWGALSWLRGLDKEPKVDEVDLISFLNVTPMFLTPNWHYNHFNTISE